MQRARRWCDVLPPTPAAIPETLAESELFGFRKGAFTGAERASTGLLRAAQEGTLFLDEISDLPLATQPKLLRALERREVVPVGESKAVLIDIRLVTATQESLRKASEANVWAGSKLGEPELGEPRSAAEHEAASVVPPRPEFTPAELDERARIMGTLAESVGSQTEAAKKLGMSRGTLIERMKRFRIPRPRSGL